ncbi:hypothetical protein DFH07DRAFT_871826 [Mycena maculata]|uniref:Reverse transcriptase zinc-binding domain-containing protein n=1 Tax=Mycena maculata TaxID=230809 RepID=A0AAD7MP54_9AGAR|nr:hypothetical protein DFH07DRAFT_871826 [Mycena maculata]
MRDKPMRKSTTSNLDRIRCSVAKVFEYLPTDSAIWTSLRSNNITRPSRNFLWKSLHDIYHVGFFWDHMPNLENLAQCPTCKVPESLEHIMLECDAPGQHQVWQLTDSLPARNRFFTIIVSTSMHLIRNLRNTRVLQTPTPASKIEIHNCWVSLMNFALRRDQLLTNQTKFVLETWSGTLLDEDSLPDDWIKSEGVLVGIWPNT